jgi:hypothetical protein
MYQGVQTVKIKVDLSITSLAKWSIQNNCNYKLLKLLNPWLRKPFVSVPIGKIYYIALPKNRIMNSSLAKKVVNDTLTFEETKQSNLNKVDPITEIFHTVLKGETSKSIAEKYQVSEIDINVWNELSPGTSLKPGTKIKVYKNTLENLDQKP